MTGDFYPYSLPETRTEYVNQKVDVHQHLAPTAESAKLLHDLQVEAKKAIEETVRVRDTNFECIIHQCFDHVNFEKKYVIVYSLNGNKHSVEYYNPLDRLKDTRELFKELAEVVGKHIADNILQKPFLESLHR